MAGHPAGNELKDLGAHWPAHCPAVAARAYRVRIGPEQMTEIADDVTFEGPLTRRPMVSTSSGGTWRSCPPVTASTGTVMRSRAGAGS